MKDAKEAAKELYRMLYDQPPDDYQNYKVNDIAAFIERDRAELAEALSAPNAQKEKAGYDPNCQKCDRFTTGVVPCGEHPPSPDATDGEEK
mgnify:CR=1 FL=1